MFRIGIRTAAGVFRASFSEQGLARLDFPEATHMARRGNADAPAPLCGWVQITREAMDQALRGRQPRRLPPLDLSSGTSFQQEVWQFLLTIPVGEVRTYGELAEALERPGSARAIGQACAANPIPLLIPCHRILAAHGRLGGYSSGHAWKRRLLECEGVSLTND
jgi:O-6-methylguanine DNA methyltransferase